MLQIFKMNFDSGVVMFAKDFKTLTGNDPYPWQEQLYREFVEGKNPRMLDIPTGLGKTSVMVLWMLAYHAGAPVPRRLVYVVDRRTIVDQASDEARELMRRVNNTFPNTGLVTSRLRGGVSADSLDDWCMHPDRPAIIVGTVDMLGSRLLFSGYGTGRYMRPMYAGLLGQDTFIVLDEAHLSPTLQETLKYIYDTTRETLKPPWLMFMSATLDSVGSAFGLSNEDLRNERVSTRYNASKNLAVHMVQKKGRVNEEMARLARKKTGRVLVYRRRPLDVKDIAGKLDGSVLLTGTMRGYERDRLVEKTIYKTFTDPKPSEDTVFLVSTSAGEVGVNLYADHIITDVAAMDSMIQRFGRVNRDGASEHSTITVVYDECTRTETQRKIDEKLAKIDEDQAKVQNKGKLTPEEINNQKMAVRQRYPEHNTYKVFAGLAEDGFVASPANMRGLTFGKDTMALPPKSPPLTDDIIQQWAMTSLRWDTRPDVAPYLHGKEATYLITYVAWREDVRYLVQADPDDIQEVFKRHRILPHETLQEPTENVLAILSTLGRTCFIVVRPDGKPEVANTSDIPSKKDQKWRSWMHRFAYSTILLPVSAELLDKNGMLSRRGAAAMDVADEYGGRSRRMVTEDSVWESTGTSGHQKVYGVVIDTEDGTQPTKLYYMRKIRQRERTVPISIEEHNDMVSKHAGDMAKNLGLDDLAGALILAGKHHDDGKRNAFWQECMGIEPGALLAKPINGRTRPVGGYRHELASALDLLEEVVDDLTIHLVASHHGHSRPHFKPNATNNTEYEFDVNDRIVFAERYITLTKKYGPWGLAYLESLLKAADWKGSGDEQP